MISVNTKGEIVAIAMRDGIGLKTVAEALVRNASGALRQFFGRLAASASPLFKNGFANSSSTVNIAVGPFIASAEGGAAPYTYLWTRTDANPESWTIGSATAASTSFTAQNISPGQTADAAFKCTVTDSSGEAADTNEVSASVTNLGGLL